MAEAGAFPAEFRKLEEDFVDSKMAINNSVNDILHNQGTPSVRLAIYLCARLYTKRWVVHERVCADQKRLLLS